MKTQKHKARKVKMTTFEIDIAQEFKDVKTALIDGLKALDTKLDGFKAEINEWKNIFNVQLSKLNNNMDKVLNQIADHEGRITKLEQDKVANDGYKEGLSEGKKFLWIAAKIALGAGAIVGAVGGCGWVLKVLAIV